MTHEDLGVNDNLINWFQNKYGKHSPLKVNLESIHDYLGMKLDFSSPFKLRMTMIDYINRMIDEAPTEFAGDSATPAAKHLFNVDENASKLEEG